MFGRSNDRLGKILLPGSSGLDMVSALSIKLGEDGLHAAVVIDNSHRIPAADIEALVARGPNLRFVLLSQQGRHLAELEAGLDIKAATMIGWDEDTIAEAVRESCKKGRSAGRESDGEDG